MLLEIRNLKMYYGTSKGLLRAVDNVSLNLYSGEALGLIGESGCGKTSLGLSIVRLLPQNARFVDGEIFFDGVDILKLPYNELKKIRLKRVSMIFQSAMDALNPVFKVGDQLSEGIRAHEKISEQKIKERVAEAFHIVDIPLSRLKCYPHELSGGMKQRILIALGILLNPQLIIADEPTTAVDVITQDHILESIENMRKEKNIATLLITHDIAVAMEMCDKLAVMYGGQLVEYGNTKSIFEDSHHPYTIGLLRSIPSVRGPKEILISIPGEPPNLINPPSGCRFRQRCPIAKEICHKKEPEYKLINDSKYSRCHLALTQEIEKLRQEKAIWQTKA